MRKFKVFYHDNSGLKCEEFEGKYPSFRRKWFVLTDETERIVIAIPADMIYSVEEID